MQHIHQSCFRLHAYSRQGSLARHACTAVSSMRIHTAACMFPPRLSRAARMHGSLARHACTALSRGTLHAYSCRTVSRGTHAPGMHYRTPSGL
jgi:hypothetical protein